MTRRARYLYQSRTISDTKRLIDSNADPNRPNSFGFTPVMMSHSFGQTALLLKHGADPNKKDNYGRTALDDSYDYFEVSLLVGAGAQFDTHKLKKRGHPWLSQIISLRKNQYKNLFPGPPKFKEGNLGLPKDIIDYLILKFII